MLHIALPCHNRPALPRCALNAIRQTLSQPYRVWVVPNDDPLLQGEAFTPAQRGSYANGRKLDAVLAALPSDAGWLFAMHDDAAPLRPGWYEWLRERMGHRMMGGFHPLEGGPLPHPLGALYSVPFLRDTRASFTPTPGYDVGRGLVVPTSVFLAQAVPIPQRPWWLLQADVAGDEDGLPLYAHLGGGVIGATSRRLPTWAWPWLVRRYLRGTCRG
jgi:hypothetical protein